MKKKSGALMFVIYALMAVLAIMAWFTVPAVPCSAEDVAPVHVVEGVDPSCIAPQKDVHKWTVSFDKSLDLFSIGVRDLNNGAWMAGYEKNILVAKRDGKEAFYLSGFHAFNAERGYKGTIGLGLGANTGRLGEKLKDASASIAPALSDFFKYIEGAANFVSVEALLGYNAFGGPDGSRPFMYGFGGKVKVPFDLLRK